jgi:probable F420-dependent oxidoreductase
MHRISPTTGATMKIGLYLVLTDASMPVTELASAIEARGFDSIWVPEHSHIPTTGSTPYPGRGPVTRDFARTLDPFVALSAAASVTTTLKLGTGICLLIQRDTIHTAKTVATLDHLSGGRVLFGVGGGWNKPEMENHGCTYATRFQRLEEQLQALKAIWSEEEAEFHGEYVNFDPMWCWPKPVTRPNPPIFIGGETDHTLRRVVKYADGWLPRVRDPDHVLTGIGRLRAFARAAGRDEGSIAISAFGLPAKAEAIQPFRDAGVERAIVALAPGTPDDTLRRLDRYAALV